jgi:hypothetical protein
LFPTLLPSDPLLLLARHPLLLPPLRLAHAPGLGAWAGRTARRARRPYEGRVKLRVTPTPRGSIARRWAGIHSPTGCRGA